MMYAQGAEKLPSDEIFFRQASPWPPVAPKKAVLFRWRVAPSETDDFAQKSVAYLNLVMADQLLIKGGPPLTEHARFGGRKWIICNLPAIIHCAMSLHLFKKYRRLPDRLLCGLITLLLFANIMSGCGIFAKTTDSLSAALSQGIQQARVDSILKASADSVLKEVLKTERFQILRREWGALLNQTTDSLYQATDTVLNNMVRDFTTNWLQQVDAGLQTSLTNAKRNLTDDQLKNYITQLISKDLAAALDQLIDRFSYKLRSPEFKNNIADLRLFLDLQMDTLSRSATRGAVAVLNDSLLPKINLLLDKIVEERDRTQRGVNSTVWIILIGIAAILLLGFLARTLYLKFQYQKMLKVITTEVDNIDSQVVYDRLVGNVSKKMKAEGLEKTLRKDILGEEGLINQPEWQDKDAQVLRVLVEEVKKSNLPEAELKEKMHEKGLEEHFESVKRSMEPPK